MTAARGGLVGFLEKNLWAVMAGGVAMWSGYLTGQMTMQHQIERLDDRLKRAELQLKARTEFMGCAVRTLDRITTQAKIPLPCELKMTD